MPGQPMPSSRSGSSAKTKSWLPAMKSFCRAGTSCSQGTNFSRSHSAWNPQSWFSIGHRSPAINRASQGGTLGRWPCRSLVSTSRIRTLRTEPPQKDVPMIVPGAGHLFRSGHVKRDGDVLTASNEEGLHLLEDGSWARLSGVFLLRLRSPFLMHDIGPFLDRLAQQAHPDGGWGYAPDQPAHLEPTCLGLLALSLSPDGHRGVFDRARAVLESCAVGDGTYRLQRGREESVWPTALVLFVRSVFGEEGKETARMAGALLRLRGRVPEKDRGDEIHDIDLKLVGWPWADGNFSWVEPTAWACLALRRAGHGNHDRVREGLQLLLDRTFDVGGINYGNRHILGKPLEPVPGPTALALLALQGHADEPRVRASVDYLRREESLGDDLEHLCWARLALTAYRDQPLQNPSPLPPPLPGEGDR